MSEQAVGRKFIMPSINTTTFQRINSTLGGPRQTLQNSRRLDEGEQFVALVAGEDAKAAGVPLRQIRTVSNPHTLEVLDGIGTRRAEALTTWLTEAGTLHRDLTAIKTTFLTDRGSFDEAVSTLGPSELRGLADIFQTLSTNVISGNLSLDIDESTSAMGRELFRFAPTFDRISTALTELAASKEKA